MAVSPSLIDTLTELLAPLGSIRIRKMFGGAAVYCDGLVFGLVNGDTLYLKVDPASRRDFEAESCGAFTYEAAGKTHTLASYHRMPERLFDEPDDLVVWVRRALAASRAAQKTAPARTAGPRGRKPTTR